MRPAMWLGVVLLVAGAAHAQDGNAWLTRIYAASQRLSYTGTFVYQHGGHSEASRITRVVDNSGARERLEALDGVPREIMRTGDDVVCYLPASQTVKVDKQPGGRSLPVILAEGAGTDFSESYGIRKGDLERVAGHDAQVLILEPKDNLRYGHRLWVDAGTGMLLKSRTYNERREVMEQFAFTQIQIGGAIDRDLLKSRFAAKARDWRVEDAAAAEADLRQAGWSIRNQPPGFRKVTEMMRTLGGMPGIGQIVLSDGLAAVSVFIDPPTAKPAPLQQEPIRQGAINVYVRQLGAHRIVVVGEAPVESVRSIANAVEYRKPN